MLDCFFETREGPKPGTRVGGECARLWVPTEGSIGCDFRKGWGNHCDKGLRLAEATGPICV
jgi:hypothetical protein